jgi:hypothetical protein
VLTQKPTSPGYRQPLTAFETHNGRSTFAAGTALHGRVGVWRGGGRPNISVAAPFVWRCLTGSTVAPFPHPPVPAKYRWVPDGLLGDSRYNVAQLYARLAESIRDGKPATPSFAAAVTRHRLLDAIMRASETGRKQVL